MAEAAEAGQEVAGEVEHLPMLIAGVWTPGGGRMPVRNPQDGRLVATVPSATLGDAESALAAGEAARKTARSLPTHRRAAILSRTADLLAAETADFARVIATEGIKTIREARLEVARAVTTLRLSAEEASRLTGETIAFDQRPGSERRFGYSQREPVGLLLAITPFNDPLNLVAHKVGPAIASGNAVILKPHERTPLSALKLARLFMEAGLPHGLLQVVTGYGADIGPTLVGDRRVRMVSFTGGTLAGQRIVAAAGIKKLSLELGGNSPVIVMPDAELAPAVEACASGAFWAAGQNCLHVQRIYIQRDLYAAFREALAARAASYRLGPKLAETTDMGCLVEGAVGQRLNAMIGEARRAGARLVTGGLAEDTRMPPTLLESVPDDHPLMVEEVFGPVTVLAPFETLEEAIGRANATDYGLQAAIFTSDLETALTAVERLEAGAVMVNDSSDYRIDAMPFGGIKGSGLGREGVRSAALEMSEVKVACFNRP